MTEYIILFLCLLILLAYLFDITSLYTKIPGVILLIGLGMGIQILVKTTGFVVPDMQPLLPVLGTVGLVLIVMEASMDLKLGNQKFGLILKSASAALFLFALFVALMTFILMQFLGYTIVDSILNAIPFGIISSAVAISSTFNLSNDQREFIVYESSLSDIIGILFFDFIVIYSDSIGYGLLSFTFKGILTMIVALVVSSVLALLLHKITYHINYIIILTALVLVYVLAELVHLPALLLVMSFGIVLANSNLFENSVISKYINFSVFRDDLKSFKRVMTELTFVVRSFFFIMFGFYSEVEGLLDLNNVITATLIIAGIYILRIIFLKLFLGIPAFPYLFFSPRGLVTILLFLNIPDSSRIAPVNNEVITLVILLTILFMMIGNIFTKQDIIPEDEYRLKDQEASSGR